MQTKKVLLLQRKYTDNLGDVAIGKSMCKLLMNHNCKVFHNEFCSLSKTNTINTSLKTEIRSVKRKIFSIDSLPLILKKYYWLFRHYNIFKPIVCRCYDKVVIGGGELLQCGNFSYALYWWTRLLKLLYPNTEIYLFSVGVFDKWEDNDIKLVSYALRRIKKVYVRDETSHDNLLFFFDAKSEVIPDSVFVNPIEIGETNNHVIYGITPFSRFQWHDKISLFTDKNKYYLKCHNDINKYLNAGKEVTLFYTTFTDYLSCVDFNNYCLEKYGISYSIESIHSLDDLMTVIKNAEIVVSARMHACILALLQSRIVCPIALSDKMKSFVNRYSNLDNNDYNQFSIILNSAIRDVVES